MEEKTVYVPGSVESAIKLIRYYIDDITFVRNKPYRIGNPYPLKGDTADLLLVDVLEDVDLADDLDYPRERVLFEFLDLGNEVRIVIEPGRYTSLASEVLAAILKDNPKARLPGSEAQPGTTTTEPETAEDKRISEIRAMNWQAMSDVEIGRKLILSDSRVKQLRLKGGMKRKKRTIGLS